MSRYIKAEQGAKHSIIYTDDSGRYFRFSGGTWAWRNHNPGNLNPGKVSARNNQIGVAKNGENRLAIFPDKETGHKALLDCLHTTHKNASIDKLIEVYAPASDGNNVKKYTKFLRDKTGVHDDKRVRDFTATEFDKLWRAIEQMEGYKEGTIVEVFEITQVHKDKNAIYDYNVKKKGWVSKSECINLAKQGKLDMVICTSRLGHDYLRVRAGSPINSNLSDLVVKDDKMEK